MTRSNEEISTALTLLAEGHAHRAIAARLRLSRGTVRSWAAGRLPDAWTNRANTCRTCGHGTHQYASLPPSYAYVLGIYLGDGSIASHRRGVYRLRIALDSSYPGIIEEAIRAVEEVAPTGKAGTVHRPTYGYHEVYSYSKTWPCLFPQHGPGKKHLRPIVLTDWQQRLVRREPELLLRGLIHSDGCRFINTGTGWAYPRYAFTNLSADIRRIFTDACDLLGLRWTVARNRIIYVSRKVDVARMDRFVGPKA